MIGSLARAHLAPLLLTAAGTIMLSAIAIRPGQAAVDPANPASCPAPRAIPAGFDYPQANGTIERWVRDNDLGRARRHGWNLWAALNSAATGQPVWQSWCTETQAFGANTRAGGGAVGKAAAMTAVLRDPETRGNLPMRQFKLHNGRTDTPDPINFPATETPYYAVPPAVLARYARSGCVIPTQQGQPGPTLGNGPTMQNNGDVMIAGVVYDQSAYRWIVDNKLYAKATLAPMVPPKGQTRQMTPMPATSIALKPMLWPVPADGYVALPVWDDLSDDHDSYTGFEIQSQWPRAVAVTGLPQSTVASVDASFLHGVTINGSTVGPNLYRNASVVGVDQFYHYRPNLATMNVCDHALLDASAYYAYGRMFRQGDYLALVAMHIMTKEQRDWTFQSLWWSDRPDAGRYAKDRPTFAPGQVKGPWAHYLMTSTYGMLASPGKWPKAYNPYIELAAGHPIDTNCMNCHLRAAWPASTDEYQATGGPGALDYMTVTNPVMDHKIGVDRLWSISDRVGSGVVPPGSAAARRR